VYVPRERLVPLAQSIPKWQLLTPKIKTEIKVEKQTLKVKTEIKSEKVKVKIEKVQKVEEPETGTVSQTAIKTEKIEGVVKIEPMCVCCCFQLFFKNSFYDSYGISGWTMGRYYRSQGSPLFSIQS